MRSRAAVLSDSQSVCRGRPRYLWTWKFHSTSQSSEVLPPSLTGKWQRVQHAVFLLSSEGVAGMQQSTSTDGNLTVLHCPDPGEKLSSCRRPWAHHTMTQNKKGSSVVLCNAPCGPLQYLVILIFTARCYASAVLAMTLCLSVCPSVRLSVCPSQVGVLLKWLNRGSHKQHHTIPQGL